MWTSDGVAQVRATLEIFAQEACAGDSLASSSGELLPGASNAWVDLPRATLPVPPVAGSALVRCELIPVTGEVAEARFDSLFLRRAVLIFADGFESGTPSSWSALVP